MRYLYRTYQPAADREKAARKARRIRWRDYWRGSVYVNPLEDAIGFFRDLTSKFSLSTTLYNATLKIRFTDVAIEVEEPEGTVLTYLYIDISDLIFFYSPHGGLIGARVNLITFKLEGEEKEFHFILNEGRLYKVCSFLLAKRIPFKEYLNGSRAHLGNAGLPYREIQALKKEYGVVW